MTNDEALVEHLTKMFADPHTADLSDIVVSDDDSVAYLIGMEPKWMDESDWEEDAEGYIDVPMALRFLDFLPDETLSIIRQRWDDEGHWKKWCDEDGAQ